MLFKQFWDRQSGAFSYLLADMDELEAAAIDPVPGLADLLLGLLAERGLRLRYVLRTHVHRPDVAACGGLCARTAACLTIGEHAPARVAGTRVSHGELLVIGHEVLRVLATPGHTPGCVSYLWRDRLFCGDALAIRDCAPAVDETDLGRLFDSVTRRLFALPDETLVFPGHDHGGRSVTTIAEERAFNAAFSGRGRDDFVSHVGQRRQRPAASFPLPAPGPEHRAEQ